MNEGEGLREVIRRRCGWIPQFLEAAAPAAMEGLWRQTLLAYLDNPLPELFKEKLLAYLSRYCRHRYWLAYHSCRLRELGMSAKQIGHLLKRPTPMESELPEQIESVRELREWPAAGSPAEWALFWLAVEVFLQRESAGRCGEAIRGTIGEARYDELTALLAYARTMHFWVQTHPQISPDGDAPVRRHVGALRAEEPSICELFDEHASSVERDGWDSSEKMVYRVNQRERAAELLGNCKGCPGTALLHAPFPVMIYAEDGQVVQINTMWTELSGYGLSDIPTVAQWCAKAQPETQAHTAGDIDALFESERCVEEGENVVRTRHGGEVVWDFASVPLGRLPDGRRAILRVASDVTERRQLEANLWKTNEMLQAVMQASPLAIVVLDLEERVRLWNPAAEELFGWNEEEVIGRVLPIIPLEKEGVFRENQRKLLEGRWNGTVQVPCLRKDGTQVMTNLSIAMVRDREGQVRSLMGMMSEVEAADRGG